MGGRIPCIGKRGHDQIDLRYVFAQHWPWRQQSMQGTEERMNGKQAVGPPYAKAQRTAWQVDGELGVYDGGLFARGLPAG